MERAPLLLSLSLLFILPFLTQLEGADSIHPKKAAAQVFGFSLGSAWLARVVVSGNLTWVQTPTFWPLLGLLAWMGWGAFLSPFPQVAWRAFGEFAYIPLWYGMLVLTCWELWKAENLLVTFIISAFGTCLWAIAQALGWGNGPWLQIVQNQFGGRVTAGLGNPDFLAGYLLIVWPLALALALRASSWAAKTLWGCLLALSLLSLLWTGSKAGWLGWAAGFAVFCFFFLKTKERRLKAQNWIWAVGLLLVLCLFLPPMSHRLGELKNLQGDSVQFRESVWSGTLALIGEHPWRGTGFGTFFAAFPPYRPIFLALHQSERSYEVNHPHNWILEWAAETGLVGLVLLLSFWALVLFQWWKWHRLYRDKGVLPALNAGVFSAFAGVGVENLFSMDHTLPTTLIPLLFLAAFPVALSHGFHNTAEFPIRRVEVDLSKVKIYLLPLFILAMGLALLQVEKAYRGQLNDVRLKKAQELSQARNWDGALAFYDKILGLDSRNLEALYFRGSARADRGAAGDLEQALADFERAGSLAPDYVLLHFKKARLLERLGRPEESKMEMKRAIQLDPLLVLQLDEFKEARRLAQGHRFSEALAVYQRLFFDYPTCVPVLVDEGDCLAGLKNEQAALPLYALAAGFDPQNKDILKRLARTALATGEPLEVQSALEILRKSDPQNPLVPELELKVKGNHP